MIVLKALYLAGSAAFLFGAAKYLAEWKKPAQERVEYRTVEKPVPVERKVAVPVEKVHVTCFQCMHGTRDQGQPGRVYCRRFGYQMMPKAYCSMGELNVSQTIRDKVQQAEQLLNRSDDMIDKYRDAMESQYLRDAYKDAYQSNLESVRAYMEVLDAQLADLKKQYSRNLADQVRWRF